MISGLIEIEPSHQFYAFLNSKIRQEGGMSLSVPLKERMETLKEAIQQRLDNDMYVDPSWVHEYNDLPVIIAKNEQL